MRSTEFCYHDSVENLHIHCKLMLSFCISQNNRKPSCLTTRYTNHITDSCIKFYNCGILQITYVRYRATMNVWCILSMYMSLESSQLPNLDGTFITRRGKEINPLEKYPRKHILNGYSKKILDPNWKVSGSSKLSKSNLTLIYKVNHWISGIPTLNSSFHEARHSIFCEIQHKKQNI